MRVSREEASEPGEVFAGAQQYQLKLMMMFPMWPCREATITQLPWAWAQTPCQSWKKKKPWGSSSPHCPHFTSEETDVTFPSSHRVSGEGET